MTAGLKNMVGDTLENEEDIEYLKSVLDSALLGKDIDIKSLNERVKKIANGG